MAETGRVKAGGLAGTVKVAEDGAAEEDEGEAVVGVEAAARAAEWVVVGVERVAVVWRVVEVVEEVLRLMRLVGAAEVVGRAVGVVGASAMVGVMGAVAVKAGAVPGQAQVGGPVKQEAAVPAVVA